VRIDLLFRTAFLEAHHHLTHQRARSWLTILGIAVGVGSVIAMVGLGAGTERLFRQEMLSFGTNLGFVLPYAPQIPGRPRSTAVVPFTYRELEALRQHATTLLSVEPHSRMRGLAKVGGRQYPCQIIGTSASAFRMYRYSPVRGRFFGEADVAAGSSVAVLGPKVYQQLFEPWEDPVGQRLRFNEVALTIIGVAGDGSFSTALDEDMAVFIPHTTYRSRFTHKDAITYLQLELRPGVTLEAARQDVSRVLRPLRKITDPSRDNFQVLDMAFMLSFVEDILRAITLVFAVVAGIALVVGGVGLMNVLLVSVAQRTREIGLRKAAGATDFAILLQFMTEALILTTTGGILGILLGWSTSLLIIPLTEQTLNVPLVPVLSWQAIGLAWMVMTGVGLAFGIYPAWSAAKLDPITAIQSG